MKFNLLKFLTAAGLSITLIGCNSDVENKRSKNPELSQNSEDAKAENAVLNLTSIKLKNCDQLVRTMGKLTGISYADESIVASLKELKGACPTDENLDSISPSNISLAIKLSMEFCGKFAEKLKTDKSLSKLDFTKTPKMAFTAAAKDELFTLFYNQLWNGDVRKDVPSLEELKASSESLLADILKQSEVDAKENATTYVVQGLCAPVLSAAPVTTL